MILGNRVTTTRKIGSEAYAEYLNDLMTSRHYDWLLPVDDSPEQYVGRGGHRLWASEAATETDPWVALWAAVVSVAVKDYVGFVRRENWAGMMECRRFFRQNEETWPAYEEIERRLRWAGDSTYRLNLVERGVRILF